MDKNLTRWIFQSIAKHFKSVADGLALPYFVEGVDERSEADMREDHVELRVTGPVLKELSKGYWHIKATVNFLLTQRMRMSGADAFSIIQWAGEFADAMTKPIPIYKLGTSVEDTGELIGCLQVRKNRADAVHVYHFGQIKTDIRVRFSEVDALYEMFLSN